MALGVCRQDACWLQLLSIILYFLAVCCISSWTLLGLCFKVTHGSRIGAARSLSLSQSRSSLSSLFTHGSRPRSLLSLSQTVCAARHMSRIMCCATCLLLSCFDVPLRVSPSLLLTRPQTKTLPNPAYTCVRVCKSCIHVCA
jgi:hypothetical protein